MNTKIVEKFKENGVASVCHYESGKPISKETLIAEGLSMTLEGSRDTARHGVKIKTGEWPMRSIRA